MTSAKRAGRCNHGPFTSHKGFASPAGRVIASALRVARRAGADHADGMSDKENADTVTELQTLKALSQSELWVRDQLQRLEQLAPDRWTPYAECAGVISD